MLVCATLSTLAHETAGAACTRHSLRPLLSREGETRRKARTNHVARMRMYDSQAVQHIRCRPGLDPGPITPNVDCFATLGPQPASTTQSCGYGSRPPCAIAHQAGTTIVDVARATHSVSSWRKPGPITPNINCCAMLWPRYPPRCVVSHPSSTASAPVTASALSVTVFSNDGACTATFSAKKRASAT